MNINDYKFPNKLLFLEGDLVKSEDEFLSCDLSEDSEF